MHPRRRTTAPDSLARIETITATDLLARAGATPPRAGGHRLLGIDGFSGAGKTTLAGELQDADGSLSVIPIESFSLGWNGLAAGPRRVHDQLVEPLRRGEVPVVAPWDWRRDRVAPARARPVGPVVVLEGCGAGARPLRDAFSLLVWVDADPAERERRLHARDDWEIYAPHRAAFERQERALATAEGSRAAADLVVTRAAAGTWHTGRPDEPRSVRSGP